MMITFKEIDDIKVVTPDANEITLFNTSGSLAFKDESGDVYTLTKQEDLDAIAATEPKVYVALLTQTGTSAPVATVLKNTLGGVPVWSYEGIGIFQITLADTFTLNKTTVFITNRSDDGITVANIFVGNISDDDYITINTSDGVDGLNSYLYNTPIKIEVYP